MPLPPLPVNLPPAAKTAETTKGTSQGDSESTWLEDSDGSESSAEDSDLLAALVLLPGSGPFVIAELLRLRVDLRSREFARCVLAKVDATNARPMAHLVAA